MASTVLRSLPRACVGTSSAAARMQKGSGLPNVRTLHASVARRGPWDGPVKGELNRYLVIAEDYPNPGALARRLEVRETHMEEVRKGVDCGRIELAGGLLSRDFHEIDQEASPVYSLCGSAFVVQGESADEVRARVLEDDYARSSAWDASSVKIYPFLPAFIKPSKPLGTTVEQAEVVARRTPYGVSPRRAKTIARNEVFVNDPRSTGAALNNQDRQMLGNSLRALRRGSSGQSQQRQNTLDSLRKQSTPPVYNESA